MRCILAISVCLLENVQKCKICSGNFISIVLPFDRFCFVLFCATIAVFNQLTCLYIGPEEQPNQPVVERDRPGRGFPE